MYTTEMEYRLQENFKFVYPSLVALTLVAEIIVDTDVNVNANALILARKKEDIIVKVFVKAVNVPHVAKEKKKDAMVL
jgi:hypothetical protein